MKTLHGVNTGRSQRLPANGMCRCSTSGRKDARAPTAATQQYTEGLQHKHAVTKRLRAQIRCSICSKQRLQSCTFSYADIDHYMLDHTEPPTKNQPCRCCHQALMQRTRLGTYKLCRPASNEWPARPYLTCFSWTKLSNPYMSMLHTYSVARQRSGTSSTGARA